MEGRRLGEFIVREELSSGGFGTVYRAEQPALAREAVIKVLHTRLRASETLIQRFLREARLASRLDHPYAAHIYAFGAESDGVLWIAMELVRGTPLDKVLEAQRTIPLERFAPLLERICQVVQTAHEQGIVHRDLKPGNVMVLSRAGQLLPKLLDLGIAKLADDEPARSTSPPIKVPADDLDDNEAFAETATPAPTSSRDPGTSGRLTEEGVIMGSPLYMAPEQWTDAATADARTDIYALGVMSYEALTGTPPFEGSNRYMIAMAHAQQELPKLGREFPPALDAVLAKAVAKQPGDRYASALELAAAFNKAAGIADDPTALPRLPDELRLAVTARAPQPIAQAASALEAARNLHAARDAVWQLVRVAIRFVALTALAAHAHVGKSTDSGVTDAVRKLRGRALPDGEWLAIAQDVVRPFSRLRDAYPIPELVDLLDGAAFSDLLALRDTGGDDVREQLATAMPLVERMLRALAFLADYRLVVPQNTDAELWMGVRRSDPARATIRGRTVADGQPVLLDASGLPVVTLYPFIQLHEPARGVGPRLHLFEGKGRRGARLVALPEAFEHDDEALWEVVGGLADDQSARTSSEEVCPFPGLSAFGTDDAARFFGRERETEDLVNRLRVQPLIAVVGPSGAGKSSFVQAGVLPRLPEGWDSITLRPGATPLVALTARLGKLGIDPARLRVDLLENPGALGTVLRQRDRTLVIVVDQLEEVFTLCEDEAERALFADVLVRAARSPDDPVRVIVTLRDDFLLHAEALPALRAKLAQALHLLTTPGKDDLRRILAEPLRAAGYELDDATLAGEMVDALANTRSALALLSFTGTKLWELRDRRFRQITRKAYTSLGGVGGALAKHAESTLEAMTPEQQRLVREVFRHAVTADGTRAVLARAELDQILGGKSAVVEKLIAARLLVAAESATGGEQIEITHEALIDAWPRLVTWRREDAEGVRLRDQLRSTARQWDERGRPTGLLWRGDALAEYRLWRSRYPGALTDVETAFAAASLGDAARTVRRRQITIAVALGVLAAGVVGLGVLDARAVRAKSAAQQSEAEAVDERARAEHDEADAKAKLLEQYKVRARDDVREFRFDEALPYLEAARALGASGASQDLLAAMVARGQTGREHVLHHDDAVLGAEFSRDGTRLVTAGADKRARVWTSDGRVLVEMPHAAEVLTARFRADGTVATASADGHASVWDASGKRVVELDTGDGQALLAALPAPTGDAIATIAGNGGVALWSADGKLVHRLRASQQENGSFLQPPAAFSADGTRLAVGDANGKLRVWDASTGAIVVEIAAHRALINSVAFSPDGKRVATASDDNSAAVWETATGKPITVVHHTSQVLDVVFSPDGRHVATASNDHLVKVSDATTGDNLLVLAGHTAGVNTVRFSPDGAQLASGADDASVDLWDATTGRRESRLVGHRNGVSHVSFDPAGKHVVSASLDATAIVWSAAQQQHAVRLVGHDGAVFSVELSRDGKLAVTGGADATARVWDAALGTQRHVLDGGEPILAARLSPDQTRIATGGRSKNLQIWNASSGQLERTIPTSAGISDLAWSASGDRIVTANDDGIARVWHMPDGAAAGALTGHTARVTTARFSPDDAHIVTTSPDKTTRVWDARALAAGRSWTADTFFTASFDPSGRYLVARNALAAVIWAADDPTQRALARMVHDATILDVAWSPDGQLVVTASIDATVRVWARSGELVATFGDGHTQWYSARFSPDGGHLITGSSSGVVIWDLPPPVGDFGALLRCKRYELSGDTVVPIAAPSDCT